MKNPPPISPDTVDAVIFDLDGVLMDSEWMAFLVWREYAGQFGGRLEESAFPHMIGLTAEETAEYVMRAAGVSFNIVEGCAWAWQRIDQRLQGPLTPIPGAVEFVRFLAGRGIPIAIASNSPRGYIDNALHGLGLSDFFSAWVGVDEVAQGKPAPDVYLRAAELLGADPARSFAVEDSRVGVQAAAAAGMRVLAIPAHPPKNGFDGAWRIFPSLAAAHQALKEVLNGW